MTDVKEEIPSNQVAQNGAEVHTERMLPQSRVDEIVKGAKLDGYHKGKQDAMNELKAQAPSSAPIAPPVTQHMGGMPSLSEDQVRRLVAEEQQKIINKAMVDKTVTEFTNKMNAGATKYPDFEKVVAPLNLPAIPHIVGLANGVDNTADVMYDLGQNPHKVANLLMLAHTAPHLAQKEMDKLSASIKQNDAAKNAPVTPDPLSQIKSSITGIDNGHKTVSDLRTNPQYRV